MKICGTIAVDVGTSSCKLGVVTTDGDVFFTRRRFFPVLSGEYLTASLLFSVVLEELNSTIDCCVENKVLILGICISGNGPTIVSVDRTNREKDVLLMWNEKIDDARQGVPFAYKDLDCIENSLSIFLPRLLAFKTKYAPSYQNAQYLLPLVEYLTFRLTGCACTLLPEERFAPYYWQRCELDACGVNHSLLPPFVELGFCAGYYRGVKVFVGPPDYVAALIGSATLFEGTACDVAGSSEGINITVRTVPSSLPNNLRVMPSPVPNLWTVASLFSDVGTRFARRVEELARNYMFRSSDIEDNFLEVMEVISTCYFKNFRTTGASSIASNDSSYCINACVPSCFFDIYDEVINILSSLKAGFDLLEKTTGFKGTYVLSGGHAKNEAYTKMKAHFTGRSFSLLRHSDAELLGDAAIVFYRCRIFSSLQEAATVGANNATRQTED